MTTSYLCSKHIIMYKRSSIKRERVIDLTDIGRNNTTPVVRELRSLNDLPPTQADAIDFVKEDRDIGTTNKQSPNLQDPDGPFFEEQLEAQGATILDSTTYYPASKISITKRSMTPEESAAERAGQYYLER